MLLGAIEKLDTFFGDCEEGQEALKVIRNLFHNKAKTSLMQPKLTSFFKSV
jgi:hypothetical protein